MSEYKKRYTEWSDEDRLTLVQNYKNHSYKELSEILGRTPDSIRKYLKSMKLKKKERDTQVKIAGKRGRRVQVNSILNFISEGKKLAQKKKHVQKLLEDQKKKNERERKWVQEFTKDDKQILVSSPTSGVRIHLLLNKRIKTTIEVSDEKTLPGKLLKLKSKYDSVEILRTQNI